jgi:hypothetical protein
MGAKGPQCDPLGLRIRRTGRSLKSPVRGAEAGAGFEHLSAPAYLMTASPGTEGFKHLASVLRRLGGGRAYISLRHIEELGSGSREDLRERQPLETPPHVA